MTAEVALLEGIGVAGGAVAPAGLGHALKKKRRKDPDHNRGSLGEHSHDGVEQSTLLIY